MRITKEFGVFLFLAVAVDIYSKVLVATGYNGSYIDDIEVIDLLTHEVTCEKLQNFPRAEYLSAGGLGFDEKPLICGGVSGSGSSSCYLYENGAWVTTDSLKQARHAFAMTKYPSKIGSSILFLTGGYSSTSLSTTEVLTENGWQTSVPLPVTIHDHCMFAVNSTSLLVIGGSQNNAESGASYYFNSETNIWSEGPTLAVPRRLHSCGSIRRHNNTQEKTPIVVGGVNIDSTELLDTNTWTRGPNLPFAIQEAAMVEDPSGGVVLIGGRGNGKSLDTLYRLPHAGSDATWEEMPQKLKTARYAHTAFLVPNEIAVCN